MSRADGVKSQQTTKWLTGSVGSGMDEGWQDRCGYEIPGAWYHVTARGNERRAIFRGDRDYVRWVEILEEAVGRFRARLHGYTLDDQPLSSHRGDAGREPEPGNAVAEPQLQRMVQPAAPAQRAPFQGRFKAIIVDPKEWGWR